ncbi:peptide chain release factor 2 [bacterium]|nr:peptide chain release factor 2 [bacterium]
MTDNKDLQTNRTKAEQLLSRFNLDDLHAQEQDLQNQTLQADFWTRSDAKDIMSQLSQVQDDLAQVKNLTDCLDEVDTAEFLLADEPENEFYQQEIDRLDSQLAALVSQLEMREYLTGPYDHLPAIFSVHSGQGGTEAMDWASMLARAYTRFFERQGWHYQLIGESRGEEAGIKAISWEIKDKNVYGLLKYEAGTHRLVRLSPFNADNLRQTSFALVEVLPIIPDDDQDLQLNEADLSWHFTRSGGAGGQNVNKVNTAVELTYLPLQLTVRCREERSQAQNKERALQILRAKLALMKQQQRVEELSALKNGNTQASWGTQIRNYVLHPYQLVKDVRTGAQTSDTAGVLDGDFALFVAAAVSQLSPKNSSTSSAKS